MNSKTSCLHKHGVKETDEINVMEEEMGHDSVLLVSSDLRSMTKNQVWNVPTN
jgi:hypothetical protein